NLLRRARAAARRAGQSRSIANVEAQARSGSAGRCIRRRTGARSSRIVAAPALLLLPYPVRAIRAANRKLLRGRAGERQRIVVEHRREPALGLLDAPAFAGGVVRDLIALDLADAEIVALGMAEIE